MVDFPATLDEAVEQAKTATKAAIAAGYTRLSVELLLPELKPLPIANQYLQAFTEFGVNLKVFFSDAGTAALAKRDWGEIPFRLRSIDVAGSRQTSTVDELVDAADQLLVFVAPTAVEVAMVEQICNASREQPIVLLNARLEDVGTVGIGYTARQIRNRFLSTFEPCYHLRPVGNAAVLRCYPAPWQVWQETETGYQLLAEEQLKPSGERLDEILSLNSGNQAAAGRGLMSRMQRFLRALSQ